MKKVICILLSFMLLLSTGCSKGQVKDNEVDSMKRKMLELESQVENLNNEVKDANSNIETLQSLIPKKDKGDYFVKAARLNMRQGPSMDDIVIGTLNYATSVNVIDTSNSLWYKVSLDLSSYKSSKEEDGVSYVSGKNRLEVKNDYTVNNLTFYVSSTYLIKGDLGTLTDVPEGKKPFVYGLMFYDEDSAKLLASEIWSNMKSDLEKMGYTGVKIEAVNRDTYEEDIKANKYDAVESAPGQLAAANEEKECLDVFAKDVINGETSYSGVILVNKKSNIVDPKDLKGKKVLAGKEFSESSYIYQKYYLQEVQGIDVDKDLKLDMDHYHQEIFYKVAKGEVDAGFCGDFVMTNSFGDMKENLTLSGIDLKSKEELKELRENVLALDMSGISTIPNNPHAVKAGVFNKRFVDKLFNCVKTTYSQHKEGYDITEATSKEYEILNQFE